MTFDLAPVDEADERQLMTRSAWRPLFPASHWRPRVETERSSTWTSRSWPASRVSQSSVTGTPLAGSINTGRPECGVRFEYIYGNLPKCTFWAEANINENARLGANSGIPGYSFAQKTVQMYFEILYKWFSLIVKIAWAHVDLNINKTNPKIHIV